MKNQKGFIPIVLAIVIGAIALGLVGASIVYRVENDKQTEDGSINQVVVNTNTVVNTNVTDQDVDVTSTVANSNTNEGIEVSDNIPTYSTGRVSQAISIAAKDQLTLSGQIIFPTDEGTIEMWVKPTSSWLSSSSGYWELLSVTDKSGHDVFELRRGKDAAHDNLQFIAYNPDYTIWKTSDQRPLQWDQSQWYSIVATWSKDHAPQIYINGIAQTMETSYGGTTWQMSSAVGGMTYIGQRGIYTGAYPADASIDEVLVSSNRKIDAEVIANYNQVMSNKELSIDNNTLWLLHFNDNLIDEKSSESINYINLETLATKTADWQTYTNSNYHFSIKYPANSFTTPQENPTYIRIQNYDPNGPDVLRLSSGEYYLEMSFSTSGDDWCATQVDNSRQYAFGTKNGIRGDRKPGGDTGGVGKVACVDLGQTNVYVSSTVATGDEAKADLMIDSLTFTQ